MSLSPTSPVSTPHYFTLSGSAFDPPSQSSQGDDHSSHTVVSAEQPSSQPPSQDFIQTFDIGIVEQAPTVLCIAPSPLRPPQQTTINEEKTKEGSPSY